MKDLNFRNLHSLKYEILKKSWRVSFFRLQYFPYVSKGIKIVLKPSAINCILLKSKYESFMTC